MFKGFKEFLSRGNIIDLSTAVVIGTAFTALVTQFTDSIIKPLINRIGVNQKSDIGILRISIGGGQTIDLNNVLSAAINFIIIAAVVYFLVVLPYTTLRKRGEVEQADDAQIVLLTEIRDLLGQTNGSSSGKHGGTGTTPPPEHGPRADAESL
ncbi:MAG: large-conductance mechanosensitive channel protein MscL [Mycobacterium sp.]|uniref:large-conductance mechanosensitive channel protein MscL n=1 Tax=Mycobacterium sp. TaxID=1785 RepID=UPI001EB8FD38|nr:large-conductance mechanosensitive channel protein MscL [Mycobacterium sp.]MBV8789708.1 large-conductance mechanosensitive channel protein MscL [Mycobacterium sp.]